jgi:hypothetical protein
MAQLNPELKQNQEEITEKLQTVREQFIAGIQSK